MVQRLPAGVLSIGGVGVNVFDRHNERVDRELREQADGWEAEYRGLCSSLSRSGCFCDKPRGHLGHHRAIAFGGVLTWKDD